MTPVKIATIVEGHGECEAVPILVRRIALEIDPGFVPEVLPPLRTPASRLIQEGELERAVEFVARKLGGPGGIIVIIDCDWQSCCPAQQGPKLLQRAKSARRDLPISIILAKSEYESWFIAAAESLRGMHRLPQNLESPLDAESIRGAKEWLSSKMDQMNYSEATDQAAFTAKFDMVAARKTNSFDKCYRDIRSILEQLRS